MNIVKIMSIIGKQQVYGNNLDTKVTADIKQPLPLTNLFTVFFEENLKTCTKSENEQNARVINYIVYKTTICTSKIIYIETISEV